MADRAFVAAHRLQTASPAEHGGSWPIIADPDKRIAARYGVTGVPETFLINPDGFVAAKLVGGVTDEQLESVLDAGRS